MSLPALILFNGDWEAYVDQVYSQYLDDIVTTPKIFRGKPVKARYNPATDGKGFSFWHLISEGSNEDDRTPDIRRCERISWIGWVIEQADSENPRIKNLVTTRTVRGRTTERLVLWCEDAEFVVILEERTQYFHLVTAYSVSGHRAEKLKKEWDADQK